MSVSLQCVHVARQEVAGNDIMLKCYTAALLQA